VKKFFTCLIMFPILLSFSAQLNASHIVGGEITYRCLGDNNFEISMIIYRDCFYGLPFFDDPASIGFFDENNQLDTSVALNGQILMEFRSDDTLSPVLENPCHVVPPDVCVHTTTYRDTVHLPFREGGYQLVYQRCCRNQTIVNLVDPDNAGASYTAFISARALQECNNSAEFREWPPFYICVNERIEFDHSATDLDGDSLVYKLCEPLSGVFPSRPVPRPPNPPPYDPVEWVQPTFSLTNMLGGEDSLQIDPHTGLLTGTPTIIGQFVVGICVEEYRDGELISTTNRDFQYNVGVCGETTSSFFAAENYCNQFEIRFENLSDNALGQLWVVGDLENPYDSSSAFEPLLSFPEEAGDYEVTLISIGNTPACNDTFTRTVSILDIDFEAEIGVDRGECTDSIELTLSGDITSSIPGPNDFFWQVEWEGDSQISTDSALSIIVTGTRTVTAELRIINQEFGCWRTISEEIPTGLIFDDGASLYQFICKGTEVELYPGFDESNTYVWSPVEGLIDPPESGNPLAMPLENTIYTAEVINENCKGEIVVEIEVFDQDTYEEPDTICAVGQVTFSSPWGEDATGLGWWFFRDGSFLGSRTGTEVNFTFFSPGDWEVMVFDRDATYEGCRDTLFIPLHIIDQDVEIFGEIDPGNCIDTLNASFTAQLIGDLPDPEEYIWLVKEDTFFTTEPVLNYEFVGKGEIEVRLIVPNELGCELDAVAVFETGLEEEVFLFDSARICLGDSLQLETGLGGDFSYLWTPNVFLLSPDTLEKPIAVPQTNITYTAQATRPGCEVFYEIDVEVVSVELELDDLILCDTLGTTLEAAELENFTYNWTVWDGDDLVVMDSNRVFPLTLPDFGSYEVELSVTDTANSCSETLFSELILLDRPVPDIEIIAEVLDCTGPFELQLTAGAFEGSPEDYDFFWQIGGDVNLTQEGFELLLIFDEGSQITIELTIVDSLGCSNTITIDYTVDVIGKDLSRDTLEICLGDTTFLNPGYSPDFDYLWVPAFGLIDGITNPNPRVSPSETTLYTAQISEGNCTVEKQVLVIVHPLPQITNISANPNSIIRFQESSGLLVEFSPPDAEVSWMPPGSLDNPFSPNPEASPDSTTTYTAVVTSEEGCVNSASIVLVVLDLPCEIPYIFLPNAFSPNGDGENDVLYLRGVHIDRFDLIIYNRWGQEVFRTNQLDRGWDGTFQGEDQPSGAYGYYLDVECIGGERFSRQGNVNLIR
jgi:gliding motility-associated-like protein